MPILEAPGCVPKLSDSTLEHERLDPNAVDWTDFSRTRPQRDARNHEARNMK